MVPQIAQSSHKHLVKRGIWKELTSKRAIIGLTEGAEVLERRQQGLRLGRIQSTKEHGAKDKLKMDGSIFN